MHVIDPGFFIRPKLYDLYKKRAALKLKSIFSKGAKKELEEVDKKIAELKKALWNPRICH